MRVWFWSALALGNLPSIIWPEQMWAATVRVMGVALALACAAKAVAEFRKGE